MHKSGDEWGVLEPEAEAVGEDFEAATGIERAEVGGYRGVGWGWSEGLVKLLLLRIWWV